MFLHPTMPILVFNFLTPTSITNKLLSRLLHNEPFRKKLHGNPTFFHQTDVKIYVLLTEMLTVENTMN